MHDRTEELLVEILEELRRIRIALEELSSMAREVRSRFL